METKIRVCGQDSPSVANSFNVAIIYEPQGKYEEALEMLTKSLDIKTRIYGDSHLDVAKSLIGIGSVLAQMGKHEEALAQLQKGLEVFVATCGQEHPLVADTLKNTGIVCSKKGVVRNETELREQRCTLRHTTYISRCQDLMTEKHRV
jgi:tetratricopeptide (TPR) repeat protein